MSQNDVRGGSSESTQIRWKASGLEQYLAQVRAQLILRAIQKSHGNQSEAAKLLGNLETSSQQVSSRSRCLRRLT
jgi:DNA-binding NtrC family response regulator